MHTLPVSKQECRDIIHSLEETIDYHKKEKRLIRSRNDVLSARNITNTVFHDEEQKRHEKLMYKVITKRQWIVVKSIKP
jgi:hypothetical protein